MSDTGEMSRNEYLILKALIDAGGPLRMDELKDEVNTPAWYSSKPPQFKTAIKRLLARGSIMTRQKGRAFFGRGRWFIATCHLPHPDAPGEWSASYE